MRSIAKLAYCAIVIALFSANSADRAEAQSPVVVQPVAPVVVGYAAERRGLFGLRRVYRPIVAPAVAAPVVAAPITVARPVITPVTSYYAPAAAPVVRSYYAPAVAVPVSTYRIPVPAYVPVVGY
jgi:hypothetical protein